MATLVRRHEQTAVEAARRSTITTNTGDEKARWKPIAEIAGDRTGCDSPQAMTFVSVGEPCGTSVPRKDHTPTAKSRETASRGDASHEVILRERVVI
jgi:hypothetical protein